MAETSVPVGEINVMENSKIDPPLLSPREKKEQLFLNQKRTLDLFLERGAISKAQYDKSLGDLVRLMGMEDLVK